MSTTILRSRILDMAIHGQLVPQDPNEGTADDLLKAIAVQRGKPIIPITDNVPFSIPENWRWVKLGDIVSRFSTGPFGSMVHKSDYVQKDGTPMINPTNIKNGEIVTDKLVYVSDKKASELFRYRLATDDIILARRGDLSKCAIVTKKYESWLCGTGSFMLHLYEIYPPYFELVYASDFAQSYLTTQSVGATMDNLNQTLLGKMPIPLPPLPEQRRIVAKVEELLSEVDKIEHAQADITHAATILRSRVLDSALKGELTHSNTEEWESVRIGDICKTYSGGTPSKSNPEYYQDGNIPWVNVGDLTSKTLQSVDRYISILGLQNSSAKIYPKDTLLVAMYCNDAIGKCSIIKKEMCSNQAICGILPTDVINQDFLYYVICSKKECLQKEASGGAQSNISQEKIKNLFIPLPPLPEQRRIVAKVEELFAEIDKLIN